MTDTVHLKKAIPVFPQPSVERAAEFYREKLGFVVDFIYDEGYAGVSRDGFELHFWKCGDKHIAENTSCRVGVENIDPLYEEFSAAGVVHPNGKLQQKPWGFREFAILDEAGNLITFAEEPERK
jgi:catechol 2,3-dioxygenase-like lactoylglutathione lyase family enzyme